MSYQLIIDKFPSQIISGPTLQPMRSCQRRDSFQGRAFPSNKMELAERGSNVKHYILETFATIVLSLHNALSHLGRETWPITDSNFQV